MATRRARRFRGQKCVDAVEAIRRWQRGAIIERWLEPVTHSKAAAGRVMSASRSCLFGPLSTAADLCRGWLRPSTSPQT
jgi:hypothetical protein